MEEGILNKQGIINKLAANPAACWIFWEVRNMKDTFEEPDDFGIKSNGQLKNHTMADTIENIIDSVMKIIGIRQEHEVLNYDVYDIFDALDITLAKDENGKHKFIIS